MKHIHPLETEKYLLKNFVKNKRTNQPFEKHDSLLMETKYLFDQQKLNLKALYISCQVKEKIRTVTA